MAILVDAVDAVVDASVGELMSVTSVFCRFTFCER